MTVAIFPLDLGPGMIARTLVMDVASHTDYEVVTRNILDTLDEETSEFWYELLKDYPYETTVYQCVPAAKPLTPQEAALVEMVNINAAIRRDLETGDLYVSRSIDADSAALDHDAVVEGFKLGTITLMTLNERIAVYGPGKMFT